jgi:hypothetical protein
MSRRCGGCDGILGVDCWNEEDCMMIAHAQEQQQRQHVQSDEQHIENIYNIVQALEQRVIALETALTSRNFKLTRKEG